MSKGNTKTNANTIGKRKRRSGTGNFVVYVLVLALLACLLALGWFAYQYNNEQNNIVKLKSETSEQRILIKELRSQLPFAASGNLEMMGLVEKDSRKLTDSFNWLLSEKENLGNGQNEFYKAISSAQKKWQKLNAEQANVMLKEQAISGMAFFIPEALQNSDNINKKLRVIRKGLVRKDNSNRLLNSIERFTELTSELDKGMLQLNTGVLELPNEDIVNKFPGLAGQLKGAQNAMIQIAKENIDDISVGGMAKAIVASDDELNSYEGHVTNVTTSLVDFVSAKKELVDFEEQANELEADILAATEDAKSKGMFGIDYLTLLVVFAALAFILLALVMVIILTSQRSANKEARKLQIDAETRTKSDQEAILRLMDDLADLSDGDLTIEAQVTEDFTGAIADSVNFTVESMREMVGTIIESSSQIESATEDTRKISQVMEKASIEQSKRINESSETSSSMSHSLNDIAENTDASVEIARASVEIAQDGRNRVRQTIENMNSLRENIQSTSKRIKRLGESSQEIGDIVEIIKGIADQTNVLALNAAIQATGAGEAGRGFAVVADEVQQLAERSSNASKRIETIVKTIQTDASEAVASMEESTKQVVSSANVTEEAGISLDKIENVSQSLAKLIINVSKETKKAAEMANNVSYSMTSLTKLNQATTRDVDRAVASVDNLSELSHTLKDSVSGFKLVSA